jgi:hypothetical protein
MAKFAIINAYESKEAEKMQETQFENAIYSNCTLFSLKIKMDTEGHEF